MKKHYALFLFILLLLKSTTGFGTKHTIAQSGFTFNPDSISAQVGDTIVFTVSAFHNVLEVYDTSWALNHNTSNGGFSIPAGGGMTVVTQAKIYYYVCGIHYAMGMKGRIFVTDATGINPIADAITGLEISPNPATEKIIVRAGMKEGKEIRMTILNMAGKKVLEKQNFSAVESVNVSMLPAGIYFCELRSEDSVVFKKFVVSRE